MSRLEQELIAHASALRALARDLAGSSAADDLVQETALAALRAERREGGSLASFFSTILRRLATRHRRGERRRLQRERLAARPEAEPPVDALLAQHEMLRRLTEALVALPEPYRGALLQRYYEDQKPAAIAARSNEPLATVKSRLQRGLSMLRERLDRDGARDDWRAALLLAFGIGDVARVAAATTGVLTMGMGVKLALGVAAAVTAVATASYFLGGEPQFPAPVAIADHAPALPASGKVADAAERVAASPERLEVPTTAANATEPHASIHGRCVDVAGNPLCDVAVSLRGCSRLDRDQLLAWESEHQTVVAWEDQQTSTASDGRFALTFAPPPPYRFELRATMTTHAEVSAEWSSIAAIAELDVGDVVLRPGALVRGRVVDTAGIPVDKVQVLPIFEPTGAVAGAFHPALPEAAQTAADGSFTLPRRSLPGPHQLQVVRQVIARGDRYVVPENCDAVELEVVLLRPEERQTIEGVVVDQHGAPVPRVSVSAFSGSGGRGWLSTTDEAGHFVVSRQSIEQEDPRLRVCTWGRGEDLFPEETFAWGRRDVRLVIHGGVAVEVQVRTADGGLPVQSFAVRIFLQRGAPENSQRWFNSYDFDVRASGNHDGGIAHIDGITRGPQFLFVEPDDAALAASSLIPMEVREPGPVRVTVRLQRAAQQQVRVHFSDGTPVAGAEIRVVDTVGREFGARTVILPIDHFSQDGGPDCMLLVMAATTDAQGNATLRGARGRSLLLELPGPGHMPTRIADVALDATAPLDINVARGGKLVGTAAPLDIVRDIRLAAGMPAHGSGQTDRYLGGMQTHGFSLVRGEGGLRERFPDDPARALSMPELDGSFGFDGVPPGTWELVMDPGSRSHAYGNGVVATVNLREGETTRVEVDLSRLAPATLDGLVLINARPLANAELWITCSRDGRDTDRRTVETDAAGRFRLRHAAASFRVAVRREKDDGSTMLLRASETVETAPGAGTNQTFTVNTGQLRIRLLDPQGRPAASVPLRLHDPAGTERNVLPKTDNAGIVTCEAEAGTFAVFALPRRLLDADARKRYLDEHRDADPFAAVRLRIGDVQIAPTAPPEVTMQLPPQWDR